MNLRRKKGFTMTEVMIVVAIIAVLAALIVTAVFAYLRSMAKLEYDGYAKEIFIAAQNHLTSADSQGYLMRTEAGTKEEALRSVDDTGDGVYVFVITSDNRESVFADKNSIFNLMLPYASVDETVRADGCYLIRYHKDTAQILDVFFWAPSGRYAHTYANADYTEFLNNRENKSILKTYGGDKSVIGYYGGVTAKGLTKGDELKNPSIVVENGKTLSVRLTDPNYRNDKASWKLIITGLTSGNSRTVEPGDLNVSGDSGEYTVILDDITQRGMHFYDLFCSSGTKDLIPGEDITIQAYSYNGSELTNVAYSSKQTTNSLFDFNGTGDDYAAISGIRHLENLDKTVSGVASDNTELRYVSGVDSVLSAAQTTDISWDGFTDGRIFGTGLTGEVTAVNGTYFPVTPEYRIDYNGNGLSVSGLPIVETGLPAGMFGILQNSSVKNLVLEDISAEGKNAGALAGETENTDVLNVLAKNASPAASITGTECAGGLIGKVVDGGVSYSAASVIVSGAAEAGGLIGKIDGASVTGCYSAGHTADGEYNVSAGYNVASANGSAGGLAGSCKDAVISCSYSTCSAEGQVAGGLVGAASGSTAVNNSYCTGAVGGPVKGAVAGSAEDPAAFTECSYFKIINEFPDSNNAKAVVYLGEFGDGSDSAGVSAFDENLASFKEFTAVKPGVRISALPYDSTLNLYDRGIYPMPGIEALSNNTAVTDNGYCVSSHCGDWPLPDIFAVNHPAA